MAWRLIANTTAGWLAKYRPSLLFFLSIMNPSISIACDATFGAGSENFGTVTGNVTFQDGSANSGTVTGNAVFEGTAENKAGATVSGNASFASTAVNNGTVSGTVTDSTFEAWIAARNGTLPDGMQAVQQYTEAGVNYDKWFYMHNGPFNNQGDAIDSQFNYAGWLATNVGVTQFVMSNGIAVDSAASHYGQWAYNSTEYGSEADARADFDAYSQTVFEAWLIVNTGVNQYTGLGSQSGKWFNGALATSYVYQADAVAQNQNINGLGNGTAGRSGVLYILGQVVSESPEDYTTYKDPSTTRWYFFDRGTMYAYFNGSAKQSDGLYYGYDQGILLSTTGYNTSEEVNAAFGWT